MMKGENRPRNMRRDDAEPQYIQALTMWRAVGMRNSGGNLRSLISSTMCVSAQCLGLELSASRVANNVAASCRKDAQRAAAGGSGRQRMSLPISPRTTPGVAQQDVSSHHRRTRVAACNAEAPLFVCYLTFPFSRLAIGAE
jgi:hypothetical protein